MTVTAPVAEALSRVEALEMDRQNLYGGNNMHDGECRDTSIRRRADRNLTVAVRATQIEHGRKLDSLLAAQERLECAQTMLQRSQARLLDSYVHMDKDVADLRKGQARLAEDMSVLKEGQARLEGRLDRLEGKVDKLEGRFDKLEGRFDGLERLVRKGFGMESET